MHNAETKPYILRLLKSRGLNLKPLPPAFLSQQAWGCSFPSFEIVLLTQLLPDLTTLSSNTTLALTGCVDQANQHGDSQSHYSSLFGE